MKLSKFFSHWDQIHRDTLAVIDGFNQVEFSLIPYPGGWSVGEIALHIVNAEDGWFGKIATGEYEQWPANLTLEQYPLKEDIKTLLAETHVKSMAYLDTLTIDDLYQVVDSEWGQFTLYFITWHVIEHEIHHRGELSLILGTLGREGLDV